MYECIVVLQYAIGEKTRAGTILPYNKVDGKAIKTITGVSPDECRRKVKELLQNNEFLKLDEVCVTNGRSISNQS